MTGVVFDIFYGILSILAGLIFADFVTGAVHWFEDRYGDPDWPIIGPAMAANQRHHNAPLEFLNSPFWLRNWAPLLGAGIVALLVGFNDAFSWFWISAILFGALSGECHAANHRRVPPLWYKWGQKARIFQSRFHHGEHHRRPRQSRYCVITPWLNPVLDEGGFWRMCEAGLTALGLPPRNDETTP